jgi:dienelactone hydrolase
MNGAKGKSHLYLFVIALIASVGWAKAQDRPYDPLAVSSSRKTAIIERSVNDANRQREIPLRIYLPAAKAAAPVVLFSHGLGGSRAGNSYLGEHWSARGYVVVFLQHAGSDETVWTDVPPARRMAAMKGAANLQNAILRFNDVPTVINALERWNQSGNSALAGRLDLKRIGMSGHSFGAVTTQGVSGQRTPRGRAAVLMSPSSPRHGGDPRQIFGGVTIPWLLMTGTKDVALVGDADVASRLSVFPALPPGGKYELVLDGARHEAFSERPLPGTMEERNPNHHRAILALSTAFWDAWLAEDAGARAWLDGKGPSSVLEKQDRWQGK